MYCQEKADRIISLIRKGNYRKTACTLSGVTYNQFLDWMGMGQAHPYGEYGSFYRQVIKAEAEIENRLLNHLKTG